MAMPSTIWPSSARPTRNLVPPLHGCRYEDEACVDVTCSDDELSLML